MPKSPDFEEKNSEIALFNRDNVGGCWAPAGRQNIGGFLMIFLILLWSVIQIWLIPLVDDCCQVWLSITKLKKGKRNLAQSLSPGHPSLTNLKPDFEEFFFSEIAIFIRQ